MQEKEIKNILTVDYDFDKWQRLIDFVFPKVNFENSIVTLDDTDDTIRHIHQKGDITLTDGKKIIILEVCIKKDNKITRAKVGFHNLAAKYIDRTNNHGLLVFYVSEDKTQPDYRLSFICRDSRFNGEGQFEECKTNPGRYTYLLGPIESATTAAGRLRELAAKKNTFSFGLIDVIEAFSVEKLNGEFVPASYIDGYITFAYDVHVRILNKIQRTEHVQLSEQEVTSGIDITQDFQDFLNKKSAEKPGDGFKVGDGVFALSNVELKRLNLNENEAGLIKPYFSPEQFTRFYAKNENEYWLIYTDSTFKNPAKIEGYPNLKNHLDKSVSIVTSDNHPYGLHRAGEEKFFKNEKILALRKCPKRPVFTYVDFDACVSSPFLQIQTERFNLKYLTALLNSKLIAFWLHNKGKMQGNNYQVDKESLLEIPIALSDKQHIIATLVDYILLVHQPRKEQLIKYIAPDLVIHSFDRVIDQAFYEIYFGDEPELEELKVLKYLEDIQPISENYTDADVETVVKFHNWLNKQTNPVRTALLKSNIISKDIIAIINSTIN